MNLAAFILKATFSSLIICYTFYFVW